MLGSDLFLHYDRRVSVANRETLLDGVNTAHYRRPTTRSHWHLVAVTVGYDQSAGPRPAFDAYGSPCGEDLDLCFYGYSWLPPLSSRSIPEPQV